RLTLIRNSYLPKPVGSLISCFEENFPAQLRDLEHSISSAYNVCDPRIDDGCRTHTDLKQRYASLFVALGRPPSTAETHATEILGDYWATRVVAARASKTQAGFPELRVAQALASACALRAMEVDIDEGLHPTWDFRIENFLRHPKIQAYLKGSK